MPLDRISAKKYWTPQRIKNLTSNKKWLIAPPEDLDLLFELDLVGESGEMNHAQAKKISQINHMIQLLTPMILELCKRHKEIRILEAGCGTSSLSLSLAWLLKTKWNKPFQLLGVDTNQKVILSAQERAKNLDLHLSTRWQVSPIREVLKELVQKSSSCPEHKRTNMVMGLHACDTASDEALILGLLEKADVVAVAPCCHRELSQNWKQNSELMKAHSLRLAFKNPQIRHEIAGHFTDALRMGFMRSHGYEVTSTEFVPSEHTPKNRLLICQRRGLFHRQSTEEFEASKEALGNPELMFEKLYREGVTLVQ